MPSCSSAAPAFASGICRNRFRASLRSTADLAAPNSPTRSITAPRIVVKYRPRIVVLYAGDNDLAFGKSSEQVAADFQDFVIVVHAKLPKTKIVFLSIKPSALRWKIWSKGQEANVLIEAICKQDPRLVYVDVAKPILGPDGKPRRELFMADGLHLNAKGYEQWAAILRPLLR